MAEVLYHLVRSFNTYTEIIAQALDAHTFLCAAVDHLAVETDVVIGQQL